MVVTLVLVSIYGECLVNEFLNPEPSTACGVHGGRPYTKTIGHVDLFRGCSSLRKNPLNPKRRSQERIEIVQGQKQNTTPAENPAGNSAQTSRNEPIQFL